MTTGQKPTAMPGNVTPLSLVETGGSLPVNHVPKRHAAAGLGRASVARPDRRRNAVWRRPRDSTRRSGHNGCVAGEAVNAIVSNPRAVQSAVMNATTSNAGRREMTRSSCPGNADELNEKVCRDFEKRGELLCLLLADGTLAVQDLGKTATHGKDWQQVLGCPAAGFHQVSQHLVRRHRWQRVVAVVMGLDQNSHGFQQCRFLRGWAANDPIRLWK